VTGRPPVWSLESAATDQIIENDTSAFRRKAIMLADGLPGSCARCSWTSVRRWPCLPAGAADVCYAWWSFPYGSTLVGRGASKAPTAAITEG